MDKKIREPLIFLKLDIVLILSVLALIAGGIAFIYSSGVTSDGQQISNEWIKQIIWASSGIFLMGFFALRDYRTWKSLSLPLYLGLVSFLILVLMVGSYVRGARAWLGFGRFGIQPSEFGKLILIFVLSWWFDERGRRASDFQQALGASIITGIPFLLILFQPDLGTALVYIPVFFIIAFFANIKWQILLFPFFGGIIVILGVLGFAWNEHISRKSFGFFRLFTEIDLFQIIFPAMLGLLVLIVIGWLIFHRRYFLQMCYVFGLLAISYLGIIVAIKVLHGYQMMRLVIFMDPQVDPRGAGWHIIQSVTAVGSGGILGKGFLKGTQSHYQYLPEQSTDFIFSIIAEEIGFIGGLIIFILFALILIRALYIAYNAQDQFGTFIAVGVAAMIGFHIIQNIGMAIGVMPITGIPLLFLSYGGSSLWTALISVGLLLSIHLHR